MGLGAPLSLYFAKSWELNFGETLDLGELKTTMANESTPSSASVVFLALPLSPSSLCPQLPIYPLHIGECPRGLGRILFEGYENARRDLEYSGIVRVNVKIYRQPSSWLARLSRKIVLKI